VKLQIQYEKSEKWYMATGFLIAADTVVTAGHCAYDWANNLQRALYIKAWIGYNGKDATGTDSQYRYGSIAVTTSGWLSGGQNVINDVALVRLNQSFTGTLNIVTYVGTPLKGSETLGVVGYPGDKELNGEWGAQAYQEYDLVNWDLDTSNHHMLEYAISTYGGNSPHFC
jgi:V8-like Glu-specific endopeptidase